MKAPCQKNKRMKTEKKPDLFDNTGEFIGRKLTQLIRLRIQCEKLKDLATCFNAVEKCPAS